MVRGHQKTSEKSINDPLKEDSRDSFLSQIYPNLPSFPEEKWIDLLQSEDEDHVSYKIKDQSCEAARKLEESKQLNNKAFSFVTMCCHIAWMKIIPMHFMRIDPGEDSENFEVKWRADSEPLKSPHTSDFWPVPNELTEENFKRQLKLSCQPDNESEAKPKRESNYAQGDSLSELFSNTSKVELANQKPKLEIPLSKYMSSEDYLAKWGFNDSSSSNCDRFKKENTEQIIELLGPEKMFIQNLDKFPENIVKKAAQEKIEKGLIDQEGTNKIEMCHRSIEERVSFIQKLTEHERRNFLPYLPLINEFLESDELDVLRFGNC